MFWPDAELMVFPLPWPIRARTLVIALLVLDLALGLFNPGDGVAHIAHLGWGRVRLPLLPLPAARRPARG